MKFLEHINKHRKWYLLGIGILSAISALFIPDIYIIENKSFPIEIISLITYIQGLCEGIHPFPTGEPNSTSFSTITTLHAMFLTILIICLIISLVLMFRKSFFVKAISPIVVLLLINEMCRIIKWSAFIKPVFGFYILILCTIFSVFIDIVFYLNQYRQKKKPSKYEILQEQIKGLQEQLDSLQQNQEQKRD